jgi:mannitol/fructose-specific phosphotransferase system IIA component (Ntr-type)
MDLNDLVRDECVTLNCPATGKAEMLRTIARLAKRNPLLSQTEEPDIVRGLLDREHLGSTGFGNGIAIPHCRLPGLSDFVLGFLTVPQGLDFDAVDDEPVRVIAFFFAPEERSSQHLQLLSSLSHLLTQHGVVDRMLEARTPAGFRAALEQREEGEVDNRRYKRRSTIFVICQDEGLFNDVLQALCSVPAVSEVVIEASPSRDYLVRVPLFAAFAPDRHRGFCRIIIAVIDESLRNEALRRIEHIRTASGDDAGMMVMVHDGVHTAGSLQL